MIILDSNVVSEILRPKPDAAVVSWLESQPRNQLFTTTITRAEILYGVRLLSTGQRKQKLWRAALAIFVEDLADRILSFDNASADLYAEIGATRRSTGKPISQFDAMIAAIARANGGHLATRNVRDFDGCGLSLIDPWRD